MILVQTTRDENSVENPIRIRSISNSPLKLTKEVFEISDTVPNRKIADTNVRINHNPMFFINQYLLS